MEMSKEDSFHLGVKALIPNHEGKLLLLQRNDWDLPGGRIQKNESLESALKREVYEETGLQNITRISPFVMTLSSIRIPLQKEDVGLIFAIFLCAISIETPIRLSHEHLHFDWFDPSKAAELLAKNFPYELTEKIAQLSKGHTADHHHY
jgi:8-oxo-dGTP diphosphatase